MKFESLNPADAETDISQHNVDKAIFTNALISCAASDRIYGVDGEGYTDQLFSNRND